MKVAATAVLVTLVTAFVCAVDASLAPTNPCCEPCEMADGRAPSCDCCRLATLDFPSLIAAKSPELPSPATVAALPGTLPVSLNEWVGPSFFIEPGQLVRAHSPPKLFILNASLLI